MTGWGDGQGPAGGPLEAEEALRRRQGRTRIFEVSSLRVQRRPNHLDDNSRFLYFLVNFNLFPKPEQYNCRNAQAPAFSTDPQHRSEAPTWSEKEPIAGLCL